MANFLLKIALRGLIWHVDTLTVKAKLPAMIDATQARLLNTPKIERCSPVGAKLVHESDFAALGSKSHEILAEEFDTLDSTCWGKF
jgi:hypothetical protein